MGCAIETYCYKCKQKQGPILLGKGFLVHNNILPAICPNHNTIQRCTVDSPYCNECSEKVSFLGEFVLLPTLWQPPIKTLVYNCGSKVPPGIKMTKLIQKSNLASFKKLLFRLNKMSMKSYSIFLKIDLNEYYNCPKCKSNNLLVKDAFIDWD